MKIVITTPLVDNSEQLVEAFKKNDIKTICLNDREVRIIPFLRQSILLWRIIRRLPRVKIRNNQIFIKSLLDICRRERPQIFMANKGTIIKKDVLEKMKEMGIITATWFTDHALHSNYNRWFMENYKYYDFFFYWDSYLVNKLSNTMPGRLIYLPLGIDPEFYKTEVTEDDRKKYSCDVGFVGAHDARRERILSEIIKMANIKLKIFGWANWKNSPLSRFYEGPMNHQQMAKLHKCSKICLNINLEPIVNGVNLRTFEIPAAGGFQLADYRKDIDDLFVIGKEIEVFRSEDEMKGKILYYLNNKKLREEVALTGHKKVIKDHTLEKRVRLMLAYINEH